MVTDDLSDILAGGNNLLALLSRFWTAYYADVDGVTAVAKARAEADRQARIDLLELGECAGLDTTPLTHLCRWKSITIRLSERLEDERLAYDEDDVLGADTTTTWNTQVWDYPLPAGLRAAPLLVNRVEGPTLILSEFVDYILDAERDAIRFRSDPLADSRLRVDLEYDDDGVISDRTATLWAWQAQTEKEFLEEQYGYVLGLGSAGTSSETYRTLLRAVWDAQLLGPTRQSLEGVLSAACDAPICLTDGEIVKEVYEDAERLVVVTDRTVYRMSLNATAVVERHDVLAAGDRLCDAFELIDLTYGVPDADVLDGLTLPATHLHGSYTGGLTFSNETVDVQTSTVSGRLKVSFDLGGSGADEATFWTEVHTRGIAPGASTLAQLLDTRPQPQSTDPDANSLPTKINPLQFLIENVLANCAIVAKVRPASFGPDALGLAVLDRALRLAVPPQTGVFVVEE